MGRGRFARHFASQTDGAFDKSTKSQEPRQRKSHQHLKAYRTSLRLPQNGLAFENWPHSHIENIARTSCGSRFPESPNIILGFFSPAKCDPFYIRAITLQPVHENATSRN